jgi:hypothetical protein
VPGEEREAREQLFRQIADQLNAACVQSIGKLLVFYRPLPDEEQIRRATKQAAAARAQAAARSTKAPAVAPGSKKAAGNVVATKPRRDEIRQTNARTSAPRRTSSAARSRTR